MKQKPRFVIFAHNATYDTLHQVGTSGLTAAAMGKDVTVVLLFWTIRKLAEGRIDDIDLPPEYDNATDDVRRLQPQKHSCGRPSCHSYAARRADSPFGRRRPQP